MQKIILNPKQKHDTLNYMLEALMGSALNEVRILQRLSAMTSWGIRLYCCDIQMDQTSPLIHNALWKWNSAWLHWLQGEIRIISTVNRGFNSFCVQARKGLYSFWIGCFGMGDSLKWPFWDWSLQIVINCPRKQTLGAWDHCIII